MANTKPEDFTADTSPASGDLFPFIDISEVGTSSAEKVITFGDLQSRILSDAAAPGVVIVAADDSSEADKAIADVVCTGTSGNSDDDAAAIEAAADSGKGLLLLDGNYYLGTALDLTLFGNSMVAANRRKAHIWTRTANAVAVTCFGSVNNGVATLGAQADAAATSLTLTAAGTVTNNAWYNIRTTEKFSLNDGSHYKGEWIYVTAGAGTTTLTLKQPLRDTYLQTPTQPTLRKMTPAVRPYVRGVVFHGAGQSPSAATQWGLEIKWFTDATVIDCEFVDFLNEGLRARAGIGCTIAFNRCSDIASDGTTAGGALKVMGVENYIFIGNEGGENTRHLCDVDGFDPDPPARNGVQIANVARDTIKSALGSHQGAHGLTITGNTIMRGGCAIMPRGSAHVVVGNTCIGPFDSGYDGVIVIGDGDNLTEDGLGGTDLIVANNVVTGTDTGVVHGLHVSDSLIRAHIHHNTFRGFTNHGINVQAPRILDTVIEHNMFDFDDQAASKNGIYISPSDDEVDGHNQTNLIIRENMFVNDPTGKAVEIIGPTVGAASTAVQIYGNRFRGFDVDLDTGSFTTPYVRANYDRPLGPRDLGYFAPEHYSALGWSFDPIAIGSNATILTTGRAEVVLLDLPAGLISDVSVYVTVGGSSLTSGQSKAFLSTAAAGGALLATSADASTALAGTGLIDFSFASDYEHTGGLIAVGFWSVGGTPPTFARGPSGQMANSVLSVPRFSHTGATTYTTTAPATLPSLTAAATTWWVLVKGTFY